MSKGSKVLTTVFENEVIFLKVLIEAQVKLEKNLVKFAKFLYLISVSSQKYREKNKLKIYTSYLVYSQIWLNLPLVDHDFGLHQKIHEIF